MREVQPTGSELDIRKITTGRVWIIPDDPSKRALFPSFKAEEILAISHDYDHTGTRIGLKTNDPKIEKQLTVTGPHTTWFEYIHPRSPLYRSRNKIPVYRIYPAPSEV